MERDQNAANRAEEQPKFERQYPDHYLKEAHQATFANEDQIMESTQCRCFYCGYHFDAHDEEHLLWATEREPLARTLHCPKCLVDCVLGSASGYPINDEAFIWACTEAWFNGISEISDGRPQKRVTIIVD
ncbi:MAG: hypothetical protein RBS49_04275 [Sphaerochaeta sp.]|jgi:hypothetical protein|nr:hypothetical protein [Sphaerochaeta sp.]MDX9915087.1 hypothetical protein [Sphaerochaeta sp.]